MERVDVVGIRGGEVLRRLLRGEDLLRGLLRLRGRGCCGPGEGGREVGVLEVAPHPSRAGEARRRDAVAAQSLLQTKRKQLLFINHVKYFSLKL